MNILTILILITNILSRSTFQMAMQAHKLTYQLQCSILMILLLQRIVRSIFLMAMCLEKGGGKHHGLEPISQNYILGSTIRVCVGCMWCRVKMEILGCGKITKVGFGRLRAFFLFIIKILQETGLIWGVESFLVSTTFLLVPPTQVGKK